MLLSESKQVKVISKQHTIRMAIGETVGDLAKILSQIPPNAHFNLGVMNPESNAEGHRHPAHAVLQFVSSVPETEEQPTPPSAPTQESA